MCATFPSFDAKRRFPDSRLSVFPIRWGRIRPACWGTRTLIFGGRNLVGPMAGVHDKIIANAAKSALAPLGFGRKGRSRIWIADHSWWATVVEFQPSSWSKGSYLNVAAHWLWSNGGHVSFDFGGRIAEHVPYETDEQFTTAIAALANTAAQEAKSLAQTFVSLEATADVLLNSERTSRDYGRGGWMAYHAGVAASLSGRGDEAIDMFARVATGSAPQQSVLAKAAGHMAAIADQSHRVKSEIVSLIEHHRSALRLPALQEPPF